LVGATKWGALRVLVLNTKTRKLELTALPEPAPTSQRKEGPFRDFSAAVLAEDRLYYPLSRKETGQVWLACRRAESPAVEEKAVELGLLNARPKVIRGRIVVIGRRRKGLAVFDLDRKAIDFHAFPDRKKAVRPLFVVARIALIPVDLLCAAIWKPAFPHGLFR
jgi:hypothetical protein